MRLLQGFPGEVHASVTYTLTPENEVLIDFEATSDAPTPINMAQHSYFNLDIPGTNKTILDHDLFINGWACICLRIAVGALPNLHGCLPCTCKMSPVTLSSMICTVHTK